MAVRANDLLGPSLRRVLQQMNYCIGGKSAIDLLEVLKELDDAEFVITTTPCKVDSANSYDYRR